MTQVIIFFPLLRDGYQPDNPQEFVDDVHGYLFDHEGIDIDIRYKGINDSGKILCELPYSDFIRLNHHLDDRGLLENHRDPFINTPISDVKILDATTLFGSYLRMMDLSPLYNDVLIDYHKDNRGLYND